MNLELKGNIQNPTVLVIGVFHGDEPQGNWLINKYLEEFPETKLALIPCLNNSGIRLNTRTNSNGVDLNRNFPTKNWELSERNEYFGGTSPASEVETKFVIQTVEKLNPQIILTLHAPYKVVNYDGDGLEVAQKISDIIGYPVEASIGYPTPGSFGTWAGIEKGIATITLELDEEKSVEDLKTPVFKIFKMLEEY